MENNNNTKEINEEFLKKYDELADAIFRYCYLRLPIRDVAKDVTQETFAKTWEYITKGNSIQNIKAFLYRVANNCIIDELRKKKTFSLESLQEKGFEQAQSGHKDIENKVLINQFLGALDKLGPKYKDILVMRYVQDLNPNEIAEILDETENNVSVRIHRGMKKILEILKVYG